MSSRPDTPTRPLSPHLQVYRPQLTTIMSIMHRITGAGLVVGLAMLVWMLMAAASGEGAWNTFARFCLSGFGRFLLFGWSVALFYHLCNGIRHLIWDTVHLFKIENAYRAGWIVILFTVALTALTWTAVLKEKRWHHSIVAEQPVSATPVKGGAK